MGITSEGREEEHARLHVRSRRESHGLRTEFGPVPVGCELGPSNGAQTTRANVNIRPQPFVNITTSRRYKNNVK